MTMEIFPGKIIDTLCFYYEITFRNQGIIKWHIYSKLYYPYLSKTINVLTQAN